MNEENKNIVNNGNNVETPVVNDAPQAPVNPLDQTIALKRVIPTPVEAAPAPQPTAAPAAPAPEKEVGSVVVGKPMSNIIKPIPVGDIQGSGPVASVGGGDVTIEPKKKSNVASIIILIVAVLVLIGIILFRYVFNGNFNLNKEITGVVQDNYLVYKGAKKGDKINFKVTDSLKLVLTIDEYDVQDGVGTKLGCSLKEADGSESFSLTNLWLEDDNVTLKVPFNKVGDYAVFSNSVLNSDLTIISADGKLTKFTDMSSFINEEKGLTVTYASVTSNEIQFEASRKTGTGVISYGDLKTEINFSSETEEEIDKYSQFSMGDGFIYCIDDVSKVPEETTINATFSLKLTNGKIDLDKPELVSKTDFKTYLETNIEFECNE